MTPRFIKPLLVLTLVISARLIAQEKVYESPDHARRAVIIPVGKKGFENQESRIEIRAADGRLWRWRSFASADGEHGQGVLHSAWTSDGQFFVFNAPSSGGHQPWNLATYFYSRGENRFYHLDDFIGAVTADFTLEGQDTVRTTRFNFAKQKEKEPVTMKLSRLRKKRGASRPKESDRILQRERPTRNVSY